MQTRQTSRFTRSHQLVVLATLAVVVLVTLVATLLARPPYASTAEALVGGQGQSAGDSSRARAASYAELAQSRQLATAVDRTLGTSLSATELQDRISADVVPGTLLLRIQATDTDPATAQKICAAVLQQLKTLVAAVDPSARAGVDSIGTVSTASLPTDRAAGHLGRDLGLSVPIGLLLGLLLAAALAFRRRPVRSRADVEAVVDAPLLGTMPVNGQVSALIGPDAQGADDLLRLREGFRFLGVDAASSVVVLTSPHRGHDAVESATHLAISMAEAGEDVLLVDADLRLPEVADLLRLDRTIGLSSVLIGEHDLADAVQTHASSGLAVLTSGPVPPNAAELTGSLALRDAFARARSSYAKVLVAAPSLADSDDALRLAKAADGAVLVVRGGRLSREDLRRATRRLDEAGAPILGVATTRLVGLPGPEVATVPAPATVPAAVGTAAIASRPGSPVPVPVAAPAPSLAPSSSSVGAAPSASPALSAPDVVLAAPGQGSDLEPTQPIQDLPLVSSETVPAVDDEAPVHEWPVQKHEPTPEPFWVSTPAASPEPEHTAVGIEPLPESESEPVGALPAEPGEPLAAQEPLTRAVPAVEMLEPWPGLEPVEDTPVAASEVSDELEAVEASVPVVEAAPQFVFPEPTPEDELDDAAGDLPADLSGEPTTGPRRDDGPLFESVLVEPHRVDLPAEPEPEPETRPVVEADEPAAPEPEPTPTFHETAFGTDDTEVGTPAVVGEVREDDPTDFDADTQDALADQDDDEDVWDDDEPRTGSLLDSFLTDDDDEEAEADLAPEPQHLDSAGDESDDDRVTMWRPSRWIG